VLISTISSFLFALLVIIAFENVKNLNSQ
jgi:hypothetical protein